MNVNWDQPGQMTALMRAAISGHFSTTKLLLDHVAKINLQDSYAGSTALMFSAERKYPDIVSLLLFAGANKNLRKKTGETAFELAEKNGSNDVIKIFSVYQNHCKIQGEDLYLDFLASHRALVLTPDSFCFSSLVCLSKDAFCRRRVVCIRKIQSSVFLPELSSWEKT